MESKLGCNCVKKVLLYSYNMALPSHSSFLVKRETCHYLIICHHYEYQYLIKWKSCHVYTTKVATKMSFIWHICATIAQPNVCQKHVIQMSETSELKRQLRVIFVSVKYNLTCVRIMSFTSLLKYQQKCQTYNMNICVIQVSPETWKFVKSIPLYTIDIDGILMIQNWHKNCNTYQSEMSNHYSDWFKNF